MSTPLGAGTVVGVGAWRGVGATATAHALAAALAAAGERPWLVEADPAGGVLAARLGVTAGALESVAFPLAGAARDAVGRFADAATDHGGIRVVTAPGDAFRAWACHAPRQPWAGALRELDGPVVVDLGRIRGAGPHGAVLDQLDQLLLTCDADPVSVVASTEWAGAAGRVSPIDSGLSLDIARVVVVDSPAVHHRVTRTDVAAELGDRFAGWLPWAPDAVRHLERGGSLDDRRLRRQAYSHAVLHVVDRLRHWLAPEVAA